MPLSLQPIIPKRPPFTVERVRIQQGLRLFALDMVSDMQQYPAWRPWKRPPKRGPRRGGKRTGRLGGSWSFRLGPGEAVVGNSIEYVGHVQGYRRGAKGERQTAVMRARGWPSISDRSKIVWRRHLPDIRKRLAGR